MKTINAFGGNEQGVTFTEDDLEYVLDRDEQAKETLFNRIEALSPRSEAAFINVLRGVLAKHGVTENCQSLKELLELQSELQNQNDKLDAEFGLTVESLGIWINPESGDVVRPLVFLPSNRHTTVAREIAPLYSNSGEEPQLKLVSPSIKYLAGYLKDLVTTDDISVDIKVSVKEQESELLKEYATWSRKSESNTKEFLLKIFGIVQDLENREGSLEYKLAFVNGVRQFFDLHRLGYNDESGKIVAISVVELAERSW